MVKKLYKDGKKRALTFSFDDGHSQDIRLIGLLNRYGLKCTFNLTGGNCKNDCFVKRENGVNYWDGSGALKECFKGHEIASHGYLHKNLTILNDEEMRAEIIDDINTLQEAFGCKIEGFVSAYGKYDDRVIDLLKELGIKYHRTTGAKTDYAPAEDPLHWNCGPHIARYKAAETKEYVSNFFMSDTELAMLTIWGHSFELTDMDCYSKEAWNGVTDRWELMENICKDVAGKSDVWYATNIEIFKYLEAMEKAEITETYIENKSDITLYFDIDGNTTEIAPKGKILL